MSRTLVWLTGAGHINKGQINYCDVFNVVDALKQRGFLPTAEASVDDTRWPLLWPANNNGSREQSRVAEFLEGVNTKRLRQAVRDVAFGREAAVPESWLDLSGIQASSSTEAAYATTFELLLAYLCVRQLGALSASFGVRVEGTPFGGDFDCIANLHHGLLHIEAKSGDVLNLDSHKLQCFLARHGFLRPELSILLLDYEDVPTKFFQKFKGLPLGDRMPGNVDFLLRVVDEPATIYVVAPDVLVLDVHRSGNILTNLRAALRFYWRHRGNLLNMDRYLVGPDVLGYEFDVVFGEPGFARG